MHFYEYVAAVDTDEVIIPMRTEDNTWHDLFKRVDMTKGLVSFMISNTIFLPHSKPSNPDFPAYHHMLQQTDVRIIEIKLFMEKIIL
jgi:Glycosyltransferase family 92